VFAGFVMVKRKKVSNVRACAEEPSCPLNNNPAAEKGDNVGMRIVNVYSESPNFLPQRARAFIQAASAHFNYFLRPENSPHASLDNDGRGASNG